MVTHRPGPPCTAGCVPGRVLPANHLGGRGDDARRIRLTRRPGLHVRKGDGHQVRVVIAEQKVFQAAVDARKDLPVEQYLSEEEMFAAPLAMLSGNPDRRSPGKCS